MKIYDISTRLHPGIAVWPGDTPYSRAPTLSLSRGDAVNLSSITTSLHTGTHADAPLHYLAAGRAMSELELDPFWGPARLVTVKAAEQIEAHQLEEALASPPQRLLIRANPGRSAEEFDERYVYFSPRGAERIGEAGVRLVGTDGPSVDHVHSKDLPAHHRFGAHDVMILENLCFHEVPDGEYELVALPLKIEGGDGSPVRAVLRSMES